MIARFIRFLVAAAVAAVAAAAIVAWARDAPHIPAPPRAHMPARVPSASEASCTPACRYAGVALPSPAGLRQFRSAAGVRPGIVEIYDRFGAPFPARWASSVAAAGAMPMIRVNPRGISPVAIAAGRFDGYLAGYGAALRRFGHPVAISLAPGANTSQASWGCRVRPAAYQAAWRHVVTVIRRASGRKAIWVWAINTIQAASCRALSRYPGSGYVDWVAVNGYLASPRGTFGRVLGPTVRSLRRGTRKPVLIAETGVRAGATQAAKILGLYRAAAARGVIGVVYLDARTPQGDYLLEDSTAALAAYRRATAGFLGHRPRQRTSPGRPGTAAAGSG